MTDAELTSLRLSAAIGGVVALGTVLLTAVGHATWTFVLVPEALGSPEEMPAAAIFGALSGVAFLAQRVLPLLAVLLAFSLTASRDLPLAPCLAGCFAGGLVAVAGHPRQLWLWMDATVLSEPVLAEAIRWVGRFLVPVLLAAALGTVIDDVWRRAVRPLRLDT